ncbi:MULTISPECIES: aldehyde dehydrogenase family protein [unclassified Streptomyces]|uniref:aldehyde dehydrogenase family protein n=1 Tax=unclassified Streptomyces TaxID=2593676 RepID=UPI000F70AC86|nr:MULTISPECIES: aldehyde dehydrogenase family protein [unclassified Streptomyces]AZM58205.1 betaine-aldehyde dehydrogenase [Streptomyces sp. WAC 01438]RSM98994.1 betaine-aldehyde dehydrogenase [Streptomyces sp. WAC 01420]
MSARSAAALTPPVAQEARRDLPAFVRDGDRRMWIAGQWTDAVSGQTLPNTDPTTEQPLATVPRGDTADVDAAAKAARKAFEDPSWAQMTPDRRSRILHQIADVIEEHADELATIDSVNMGAPRAITTTMLAEAGEIFRYYAGWPTKLFGTHVPAGGDRLAYTRKEPLGVVGIIWGWNGPMGQLPGKLAPALAAGNTVILKPAETASLSTLRLAELLARTDLPDGVVNVVTGRGDEAGQALVAHPDVNKIAFTGSTATGKHVQRTATESLKQVTLELGGKSPSVVFADADLHQAARGVAAGFLGNAGQACVATTRILVQESIRDEFVELLTKEMTTVFTPADSLSAGTVVGPLATKAQFDRVSSYLDLAVREGANVVTGGTRYGDHGYFIAPTLLDGVNPGMRIVREEIFGPVGALMTFTDIDDAIAKANDTEYGLAASVWTTDLTNAHRMAAAVQAGTVWINTWGEMSTGNLPFGGYKQSGLGREGGLEVLDAYTQSKAVVVAL